MLSRTADHALRALLFLADREDEAPFTVDQIAQVLGAPRNYLGKTLNTLATRGLLEGVRGPAGGYRLKVPADRVTISDIVQCVGDGDPLDNSRAICLLGDKPCGEREPCRVHQRWVAVQEAAWRPLRTTTLADLLAGHAMRDPRDEPATALSRRYSSRW